MPDTTCRMKCVGLRGALLWGLLALLLPSVAWAGGHIIKVQPPNGVDDTIHIQAALDAAMASGPGATVQLAAGRYLTQQLAIYNFHGTFKGMGKDKTTLEALPHLQVTPGFGNSPVLPNGTTNRWPCLIVFVDGDIQVSDLSIKITAPPGTATATWWLGDSPVTCLLDAIRIMGTTTTNFGLDHVAIVGARDDSPNNYGFNLWNGVLYAGEFARSTTDLDYYFLSGTLTVKNCSFKSMMDMGVDGFLRDLKVVIGGSPSTGNTFEDVDVGIWFCSAENSTLEASYNQSEGMWACLAVTDWLGDAFVPAKPSQFSIHDNTFTTTGAYADGIQLVDRSDKPWIRAMVYNNTIQLKSDFMWDGIGLYNTRGSVLWNNTISGSGADAIGLVGTTLCTVFGNHIRNFYADPSDGLAQIYLDPATNHNLVVCASPLDTVLDQGTKNLVIGGWPQAAVSAESFSPKAVPNNPMVRPNFMNRKPGLPE